MSSEQADQTPGERERVDPWAPPADRAQADAEAETIGATGSGAVDATGSGAIDATGAEVETIGENGSEAIDTTGSEAETIGVAGPPPGSNDGGTLLDAHTVTPEPAPAQSEISLTKGATAAEPSAPQPAPSDRDIWAPPADDNGPGSTVAHGLGHPAGAQPPAHGAPANPWQNPGGFAHQPPYAGGHPVPDGAVPPPPVGPEGPGPGYGYAGAAGPAGYPGYGPQAGAPYSGVPYSGAPYYGGQPGYGWPHMPMGLSNGMGTTSLVLGIIACVLFCLWPVAIIVGVLAIIFGAIGRGKARKGEANNGGQALAGLICGSVGTALAVIFLLFVVVNDNDPYDNDDPYDWSDTLIHAEAPLHP